MNQTKLLFALLGSLVMIMVLSACGPSQANLDATVTQVAADILTTQTAKAPTPTETPTNTFTPTPTSTPPPTNTPTITPTPTPDYSRMVITMGDLPYDFYELPFENDFAPGSEGVIGTIVSSSAFELASEQTEVILSFSEIIPGRQQQAQFDSAMQLIAETSMRWAAIGSGEEDVREMQELSGLDNIGEKSLGRTALIGVNPSIRTDIVVFRRNIIGSIIIVIYIDGDDPVVPIGNLAQVLNKRIIEGILNAPLPASKIIFHSDCSGNNEIHIMNADGSSQSILTNHPAPDSAPKWSPDGTKIVFSSKRDGNFEIYVMNADGSELNRITNNPAGDYFPVWSPDGTRIAFSSTRDSEEGVSDIYVMQADGSDVNRLTHDQMENGGVAWSPDGSLIAFQSNRDDNTEIYLMNADGSDLTRLTHDSEMDRFPAWSPDGTKIAFESKRDGNFEIYLMNADGSSLIRLTKNFSDDGLPAWSPDGKFISFMSLREGTKDIYLMRADGSGQIRLTTCTETEELPHWQP